MSERSRRLIARPPVWAAIVMLIAAGTALDAQPGARAAASQRFPAQQIDRQTKTLQLGTNGRLEVANLSGEVTITAGSGRETTVEIVRTSRGRTDADAKLGLDRVQAEVQTTANGATIRSVYPSANNPPYSVSVDYRITTPASTSLTVKTVSGDITTTGIRGDLSVDAISGDLRVTGAGRINTAHTISGDVTITGAESDSTLSVDTVSGTIALKQIKVRRLEAGSIGGDVTIGEATCDSASIHSLSGTIDFGAALAPRGRYELRSHSGDVIVRIDGKTGFEFTGTSFSGDLHSDVPLQSRGAARRSLQGTFGDGSATISVTTFSGDVTIRKR